MTSGEVPICRLTKVERECGEVGESREGAAEKMVVGTVVKNGFLGPAYGLDIADGSLIRFLPLDLRPCGSNISVVLFEYP